ncbi:hypothetical protein HPB50_007439 [Hyalomma asiaticum]|uniref:Uncharacterized protein n=1 Tax=Hyalomma asiaticum TaxID=266040 RepID=A0ACB7RSB2_HYAAI|nr:hypothetical protein HPB50_007439 [Hyalomma asiaticum]
MEGVLMHQGPDLAISTASIISRGRITRFCLLISSRARVPHNNGDPDEQQVLWTHLKARHSDTLQRRRQTTSLLNCGSCTVVHSGRITISCTPHHSRPTTYHYVLSSLPPSMASEIRDLLLSPPADKVYEALKATLIRMVSPSEGQRLQRLLYDASLGDRTPAAAAYAAIIGRQRGWS